MRGFEYYTPTRVIFGKDTHLPVSYTHLDVYKRQSLLIVILRSPSFNVNSVKEEFSMIFTSPSIFSKSIPVSPFLFHALQNALFLFE